MFAVVKAPTRTEPPWPVCRAVSSRRVRWALGYREIAGTALRLRPRRRSGVDQIVVSCTSQHGGCDDISMNPTVGRACVGAVGRASGPGAVIAVRPVAVSASRPPLLRAATPSQQQSACPAWPVVSPRASEPVQAGVPGVVSPRRTPGFESLSGVQDSPCPTGPAHRIDGPAHRGPGAGCRHTRHRRCAAPVDCRGTLFAGADGVVGGQPADAEVVATCEHRSPAVVSGGG